MQRLFVSFPDWSSRSGGSVDGEGTDCLNFANTLKQPARNLPVQEKEGLEEDGCLSYTTLQPVEPLEFFMSNSQIGFHLQMQAKLKG